MPKVKQKKSLSFDKTQLTYLACPEAISVGKSGDLTLHKDSWLISNESGCKYPIIDGIPIMLKEVGIKWQKTPLNKLPDTKSLDIASL